MGSIPLIGIMVKDECAKEHTMRACAPQKDDAFGASPLGRFGSDPG